MDRRIDMAVSAAFVAIGAWLIFASRGMRIPAYVRDPLTPRGLPIILGAFLVIAGGTLIVRRLLIWRRQADHNVASDGRSDEEGHPASATRALGIWLGLVAYAWLTPRLGYLIATALAVFATLWITKVREPSRILPLTFGIPVVVQILFGVILNMNLPQGVLRGLPFL